MVNTREIQMSMNPHKYIRNILGDFIARHITKRIQDQINPKIGIDKSIAGSKLRTQSSRTIPLRCSAKFKKAEKKYKVTGRATIPSQKNQRKSFLFQDIRQFTSSSIDDNSISPICVLLSFIVTIQLILKSTQIGEILQTKIVDLKNLIL